MAPIDIKKIIIQESNSWIILNKPAGLITEQNPYEESLESILYTYLQNQKKNPFVGVVHRLDRVTSGLIIFAKKKSALKTLNSLIEHKQIKKTYKAVVEHQPLQKAQTLEQFIIKDQKMKIARVSDSKMPSSKSCKLHYRLIQSGTFGHQLEIQLYTGRFHQIRAQLSHIQMPIMGDLKYGGKAITEMNKIYLHAYKLKFPENTLELPAEVSSEQELSSLTH